MHKFFYLVMHYVFSISVVMSIVTHYRISFCYRFEMPFNIWCGGCESMIAKGVRFNAEKKQVGTYYSTKVSFFHDAVNEMENFHLYAKICQLK